MKLEHRDLIDASLKVHTQKIRDAGIAENITFFLDPFQGDLNLNKYYPSKSEWIKEKDSILITSVGHSDSDREYIRSIFKRLDKIIDLDFQEMSHNRGSQIDIYSASSSSSFRKNVVGHIITQETQDGAWYDVIWKDNPDNQETSLLEKNTIIHELGHTLGLSHPKNDPRNINWTTEDTIMSYNEPINGWSTWFSELDISALKSMWGRENDDGKINFTKSSNEYEFIRNENNKFHIKTMEGKEDITSITTLNFKDRDLDVKKDIIGVFDQIIGVDHITGKIFRLYNSTFDRIPDYEGYSYWIKMNNDNSITYKDIVHSFITSREFIQENGYTLTNENYLELLYSNSFNRSADIEGYNYWLGQLNNGIETQADILINFSESDESKVLFSSQTMLKV